MTSRAKEKLRRGGTVMVFNPNFWSPALIEHAGGLGFDVAFIDCEHGSAGFETAEDLARAGRGSCTACSGTPLQKGSALRLRAAVEDTACPG